MGRDVKSLLTQLTLEEKASLCSGADFWHTKAVERLGIGSVMVTDGPHGLRKQAAAADHVGLNDSVPATCFPPAVALGSAFDPELTERVGRALGAEARAEGVAVLLGPGVNIKRSPLCGRNFEYFSEDPLVAGVLGAALVRGIQSRGVGASVKHFAANNQETDRARVSAEVDERTLREIYFPAFERVVTEARPWTVMCSYNRVNGTYASQHPWLLTTVLRDEWGFDGVVMSDWGAVDDRVAGVRAGLDLEMPASGGITDAEIVAAVRAGELDEADLDRTVERLLTLLARAEPGLAEGGTFDPAEHHALAREAAAASVVLLKNGGDTPLLPLDPSGGERIAVLGEFARTPRYQGAGSSKVNPTRLDDAWSAIREVAGDRAVFAPGFTLDADAPSGDIAGTAADTAPSHAELRAEAVAAARDADVVLLFLGLPAAAESEGFDRTHIDLPQPQLDLLAAVTEVNPHVVVVLSNGSVVSTGWHDEVPALVEGWLLGQAGGSALADVLFGAADPGGRLAETIPLRLADSPAFPNFPGELGTVRYGEGVFVGYRGYDVRDQPVAFPFGHGLSYTTFSYTDLAVTPVGEELRVEVTVTNTGARAGDEVVQVYVGDPVAEVARPVRELRAFEKVRLDAGASQRVSLTLTRRDLSYFHPVRREWVLEGGEFRVEVGASSRDLRCSAAVDVAGDDGVAPLAEDASLIEWYAHPVGAAVLTERLAGTGPGVLTDETMRTVVGNFPLTRLASFPGSPITRADVRELLEKVNAQV